MRKAFTTPAILALLSSMVVSASAADYEFKTEVQTDYYQSTNYEDQYDAAYNYGGKNQIDFDIPSVKFGLSGELLEHSLENPYLPGGIQYGFAASTVGTYPVTSYGNTVTEQLIPITYQKAVTLNELLQKDGSIGTITISRVGLSAKIFEGTSDAVMLKGAGHYSNSALWNGNVALFGHNRGTNCAYFGALKNVKVGDTVKYKTNLGTRTYEVQQISTISYTDYSYLNETGDNRLTLITCIANQPSLRLCVQAVELK